MCEECYVNESRITPLLNPIECLEHHTQYGEFLPAARHGNQFLK